MLDEEEIFRGSLDFMGSGLWKRRPTGSWETAAGKVGKGNSMKETQIWNGTAKYLQKRIVFWHKIKNDEHSMKMTRIRSFRATPKEKTGGRNGRMRQKCREGEDRLGITSGQTEKHMGKKSQKDPWKKRGQEMGMVGYEGIKGLGKSLLPFEELMSKKRSKTKDQIRDIHTSTFFLLHTCET